MLVNVQNYLLKSSISRHSLYFVRAFSLSSFCRNYVQQCKLTLDTSTMLSQQHNSEIGLRIAMIKRPSTKFIGFTLPSIPLHFCLHLLTLDLNYINSPLEMSMMSWSELSVIIYEGTQHFRVNLVPRVWPWERGCFRVTSSTQITRDRGLGKGEDRRGYWFLFHSTSLLQQQQQQKQQQQQHLHLYSYLRIKFKNKFDIKTST